MSTMKLMMIAGLLVIFSPEKVVAHECEQLDIVDFGSGINGTATVCLQKGGPTAKVHASGLVTGDAYTIWWVYFDDPSQCIDPGNCGDADFGGDNPQAVLGRMGSAVGPRNGQTHFSGTISGMVPSDGSQIWLLMFGHGPADMEDGRHLARQLLTPEDPNIGIPHLGNTVDGGLGFPVGVAVYVVD